MRYYKGNRRRNGGNRRHRSGGRGEDQRSHRRASGRGYAGRARGTIQDLRRQHAYKDIVRAAHQGNVRDGYFTRARDEPVGDIASTAGAASDAPDTVAQGREEHLLFSR